MMMMITHYYFLGQTLQKASCDFVTKREERDNSENLVVEWRINFWQILKSLCEDIDWIELAQNKNSYRFGLYKLLFSMFSVK